MNDRVILVYNNGEFDEGTDRMESSKQLLKMAQELHAKNGPLTKEEFEKFKKKCCDQKKIRIALIGKTGHGKSSTGNTILRREVFEDANAIGCSSTLIVDRKTAVFNDLIVQVFDTPGLMHVDLNDEEDQQRTIKAMDKLMDISGGIDVFLLVYNYMNRYTREDRKVVDRLEKIFGKTTFGDHGIIVLTHGDCLEKDLNDGQLVDERLAQWCSSQPKTFQHLMNKMNNRIILVYNKGELTHGSKRMESSIQLLEMAKELNAKNGSFTKNDFEEIKESCCVIF
ncbi:GTPase IMAP member 4 [Bulinus truncatus]|nr:GTPase IMAP member 4 [Bulinus truncatus]